MFAPPLFCKFGTNLKDLFKKNYEYKHQLTVVSKPLSFLKTETILSVEGEKTFDGKLKLKCEHGTYGNVDLTYTSADGNIESELKTAKYMKKLNGTAKLDSNNGNVKGGIEYQAPNVSFANSVTYGFENQGLKTEVSVVGEYSGLCFGGMGSYSVKDTAVDDYNVGVEYRKDQTTLSAYTGNKLDDLTLGIHQQIPNKNASFKPTQLGVRLETQTSSFDSSVVSVGAIHQCSNSQICRAKVDTKGSAAVQVEHQMTPSVVLSVSSQWNLGKRSSMPERFGIGLKFDT